VGTFKIRGKEEVYSALKAALDAGYRLIGQWEKGDIDWHTAYS
jgi:hypothetical protein